MTLPYRKFVVRGLFGCLFILPHMLSAASGCNTGQLLGFYNAQVTNVGFQSLLAMPPATTAGTVLGFTSNPTSLSGSLAGLGRYYFDGTGNIVGMTAASSSTPAVSSNVGTYTVNADCSASVKLGTGAAYDLFLAGNGTLAQYVRTDATGNGEAGVLRRAGSCVSLSYPGSYTYQLSGGFSQTAPGGSVPGNYAQAGTLNLNGSGAFTMAQSQYNNLGITRSTATGTYVVGADCSVTLTFSTASGANSSNFTAPRSFRFLMTDASSGLLSVQPDSTSNITGTVVAQ